MKTNLTAKDVTDDVKSAVRTYLLAKVYAETMQEAVSKVYRAILEEAPIYEDLPGTRGQQIRHVDRLYLSSDEAACAGIYSEANHRLRATGLKPDDMPDEHCPALVADTLRVTAENALFDATAEMLAEDDAFAKKIRRRVDARKKCINLVVRLVVNLPDFKPPALPSPKKGIGHDTNAKVCG